MFLFRQRNVLLLQKKKNNRSKRCTIPPRLTLHHTASMLKMLVLTKHIHWMRIWARACPCNNVPLSNIKYSVPTTPLMPKRSAYSRSESYSYILWIKQTTKGNYCLSSGKHKSQASVILCALHTSFLRSDMLLCRFQYILIYEQTAFVLAAATNFPAPYTVAW